MGPGILLPYCAMKYWSIFKNLPSATRGALFEKTAPCSIWTPRKNFLLKLVRVCPWQKFIQFRPMGTLLLF
jgi:hypothetical protein